jgi:hypothetical protein
MKPKYRLVITDRENKKRKTYAGVLFTNEYGGYNLVLAPGIQLRAEDQDMYYFNFWPFEQEEYEAPLPEGTTKDVPFG